MNECPFCPGKEETMGDWKVLALPNEFPALTPEAPIVQSYSKLFEKARAIGECEVIIESPEHEGDFPDPSLSDTCRKNKNSRTETLYKICYAI